MRKAGMLVWAALEAAQEAGVAGATTEQLNLAARRTIESAGGIATFVGYGHPPFPGAICCSVNDEIIHGIPGDRVLQPGDLVGIDCGAIVDGWHGDSARSFIVPGADDEPVTQARRAISELTYHSLWDGIAQVQLGNRLGDIGGAIEDRAGDDVGIVEEYTGHGIGTQLHMEPEVLNYRIRQRGPKLKAGICLAIEPMLTNGSEETRTLADNWTVATIDGSDAAHWEHTVALTDDGPWVLTCPDGGAAELGARGAKFANWS